MIDERIRSTVDQLSKEISVPPVEAIVKRRHRRNIARAAVGAPFMALAIIAGLVAPRLWHSSGDGPVTADPSPAVSSNEIAPGILAEGIDLRHSVPELSGHFVVISPNVVVLALPTRESCRPDLLQSPSAHDAVVNFDVVPHQFGSCRNGHAEAARQVVSATTVITSEPVFGSSISALHAILPGYGPVSLTPIARDAVDLADGLAALMGTVATSRAGGNTPGGVNVFQRVNGRWLFRAQAKVAADGMFATLVAGSAAGTRFELRPAGTESRCSTDRVVAVGGTAVSALLTCTAPTPAQAVNSPCGDAPFTARLLPDAVSPATGERSFLVRVSFHGQGTCEIRGFPRVRLLTADGDVLPFRYRDGTGQYVTGEPPTRLSLTPDKPAIYFKVAKYRCDVGETALAATLEFTVPGASTRLRLHLSRDVGIEYCAARSSQVIYLSPMEPTKAAAMARPVTHGPRGNT